MRVGIAILSYKRCDITRHTIEQVRRHTKADHELIVVDDGSPDNTQNMLEELGVAYIRGPNCGVVWNKNRAIFYLHEMCHCDVVILLEEDTFPIEDGWEQAWIDGAKRWGHVNLAPSHWPLNDRIGGTGTVSNPIISRYVTGQCCSFSREALSVVGYLDTRFRGYGHAHVEHTIRFLRAGWGGYIKSGRDHNFYLIRSPLKVTCLDKPPPVADYSKNGDVFDSIRHDHIHRWCWRDEEEMAIFHTSFATLSRSGIPVPTISKREWFLSDNTDQNLVWDQKSQVVISTPDKKDERPRIIATVSGETVQFKVLKDQTFWITWGQPGEAALKEKRSEAATFKLIYGKNGGVGFSCNGLFLCTDHSFGDHVMLSRSEMKKWEIFHFSGFSELEQPINNPMRSDRIQDWTL